MEKTLGKVLLMLVLMLVVFFSYSFSATLQVTKIGNLELAGKVYTEWWYTGTNPILYGVAAPNSEVTIAIGTTSYKTNSDAQGNWTYSVSLSSGNYDLVFSQAAEKVSFKLHLGQDLPQNINSQTQQSTTPNTGYNQMLSLGMGIGILLLATYFYVLGDPRRKSVFEAKILKED
jgi:hypothetical protein